MSLRPNAQRPSIAPARLNQRLLNSWSVCSTLNPDHMLTCGREKACVHAPTHAQTVSHSLYASNRGAILVTSCSLLWRVWADAH